jgi:hypothetical protein
MLRYTNRVTTSQQLPIGNRQCKGRCAILSLFPVSQFAPEAEYKTVTLIDLQQKLKHRVETAALDLFGIELEQVAAETPPKPELGDLAFPVAFELAKRIKLGTGRKTRPAIDCRTDQNETGSRR